MKDTAEEIALRLEIYKQYLLKNIPLLEDWSGKIFSKVLYDSERDGKESSIFKNSVISHENLYFIEIDEENNIFGIYYPARIALGSYTIQDIFLFTLYSNGRNGIKKYQHNTSPIAFSIFNGTGFFGCSRYDNTGKFVNWLSVFEIDIKNSLVKGSEIVNAYQEIEGNTLTGNSFPNRFTNKRVIVLEMK